MLDMEKLLRKHHVAFDGPNRRGWLELVCPRCGGHRLGWNTNSEVFFCWYCRGLPFGKTLAALLRMSVSEAYREADTCRTSHKKFSFAKDDVIRPSQLEWPAGAGDLNEYHKQYLQNRGLDPEQIIKDRQLRATTGAAETLLANRIIAPLLFNGQPVSWQGRSIRNGADLRYITCPDSLEVIPSKHLVYGWDDIEDGFAVVVEGLFDVWKGGKGCVHTFGVAWTEWQLLLLSNLKHVVVAYDNEPVANKASQALASALSGMNVSVSILTIDAKDFGEMSCEEASRVVQECRNSIL